MHSNAVQKKLKIEVLWRWQWHCVCLLIPSWHSLTALLLSWAKSRHPECGKSTADKKHKQTIVKWAF